MSECGDIPAYHAGTITKKWQFLKNDIVTQKIMKNINDKILRLGEPRIYSF